MSNQTLIQILMYAEPLACLVGLFVMHHRRQMGNFKCLTAFLVMRVAAITFLISLIDLLGKHMGAKAAYHLYFYVYWSSYAIEAILGFGIIYGLYRLAMEPLRGLQRLGTLMFRWAAGIAVLLAATMAFGPHVSEMRFIMRLVTQLQQTQSVLTLCMLLFVCLAIRPMGLSYSSRIFGVSLGLGLLATADLVASAWLSHVKTVYSLFNVMNGMVICIAIGIWIAYFSLPEPKRRMIILPTTSPMLRWNQISIALGDEPGYVAVGDVTADMFAPAEVEIMRRASMKIRMANSG